MIPRGVLKTIIKLRNMTPEEIRAYFEERATRIKSRGWSAKQHAEDQEKWHGLKNERTYSKHFDNNESKVA